MNMAKRLKALEAALTKRHGGNILLAVRANDAETDGQVRERLGLQEWPGVVVCLSDADVKL